MKIFPQSKIPGKREPLSASKKYGHIIWSREKYVNEKNTARILFVLVSVVDAEVIDVESAEANYG